MAGSPLLVSRDDFFQMPVSLQVPRLRGEQVLPLRQRLDLQFANERKSEA